MYPSYNDTVLLETVQRCLHTDAEKRPTIKELLEMTDSREIFVTETYKDEF